MCYILFAGKQQESLCNRTLWTAGCLSSSMLRAWCGASPCTSVKGQCPPSERSFIKPCSQCGSTLVSCHPQTTHACIHNSPILDSPDCARHLRHHYHCRVHGFPGIYAPHQLLAHCMLSNLSPVSSCESSLKVEAVVCS